MTELHSTPGQLEQTLEGLVHAGIGDAEDLAGMLGLAPQHIRRPLRKLTMAGVLDSTRASRLQLTRAGRAGLEIEPVARVVEPLAHSRPLGQPRLAPLQLGHSVGSPGLGLQPDDTGVRVGAGAALASPATSPAAPGKPLRTLLAAWRRTQRRMSKHCNVRLQVAGVQLSASAGRRVAGFAVAALALVMGLQAGLPAWGLAAVAPILGNPASHADRPAPAAPPEPPPKTPAPGPAVPTQPWVLVQHTDGLGLVLRPAPASSERVLTLQEGARVRVTGDPVQQAGRTWLPIASSSGKTGWVAAEFVAPQQAERHD